MNDNKIPIEVIEAEKAICVGMLDVLVALQDEKKITAAQYMSIITGMVVKFPDLMGNVLFFYNQSNTK